jgi:hypothetical protein
MDQWLIISFVPDVRLATTTVPMMSIAGMKIEASL